MTRLAAVLARAIADAFPPEYVGDFADERLVAAIPEPVRDALERALGRCQFLHVLHYVEDHDGVCGKAEAHRWHGQHDEGYCDGAGHEPRILCHPYQPLVAP